MKLLVTGGGGFLGRALCERLLADGHEVRSFSRGAYPELSALGIDHRQGALDDAEAVSNAVEGVDAVFHVAALPGIWGPRALYWNTNVIGTQNIIDACRAHGVDRLVYTSSPSVDMAKAAWRESTSPTPTPIVTWRTTRRPRPRPSAE